MGEQRDDRLHRCRLSHVNELMQVCIPNSKFIYDSNICKCDSEGTEITCKRGSYSSVTPIFHRMQMQNLTFECVPNRIFDFPCQKCLCDESGKYATCVRQLCDDSDRTFEKPDQCIPGSIFDHNCNGCICGADGKAACTQLDCAFETINAPHCVPGSADFLFECNHCFCSYDGLLACNRMGCSPLQFKHESLLNITIQCEAKNLFDYNCHECICGNNGNYAMCYGRECSQSNFDIKMKDTKEECTPGMIFGDKCNVCVCGSDGKGACTTFDCDIDYRIE